MICGVVILESFVGVVIRCFELRKVFFVAFLVLLMSFVVFE